LDRNSVFAPGKDSIIIIDSVFLQDKYLLTYYKIIPYISLKDTTSTILTKLPLNQYVVDYRYDEIQQKIAQSDNSLNDIRNFSLIVDSIAEIRALESYLSNEIKLYNHRSFTDRIIELKINIKSKQESLRYRMIRSRN